MDSYIKEIIRGDKICKIMIDGKTDELYIKTNSSYFWFCFNNNPSYLHLLHLYPNIQSFSSYGIISSLFLSISILGLI